MSKQQKFQKPTLRSRYGFKLNSHEGETFTGKSLTIQDDSMSIQELLERHQRGQELARKNGTFLDEDEDEENALDDIDLEKFDRQDHGEKFRINRDQEQKVREAKKRIQERKDKAEKETREKAEKEAEKAAISKSPEKP